MVFNVPVNTANGSAYNAVANVDSLKVGPISINNVKVSISKTGLDSCLLGMSFLNQLSGFTIKGNRLLLIPYAD